ncbi:hypothetical protein [Oligoflexus sp.]|uniref:hypothetical protein n=1 Tax=Oligoflexus sp. TaxID=1971216 RepID=UPI002D782E5D|nr:hypothetical protein [Oligoflexus sp.]
MLSPYVCVIGCLLSLQNTPVLQRSIPTHTATTHYDTQRLDIQNIHDRILRLGGGHG